MSVSSSLSHEEPEATGTPAVNEVPENSCFSDRNEKKHVKISGKSPTYYEDETKAGLQIYSSLSKLLVSNTQHQHCYLRDTAVNQHWKQHGIPCLVWYDYVSQLLAQRTQLTILRKLYTQKYYTAQFLFKLQHFLVLQREVHRDASFYQSYTLSGEASKLPKLTVLCKQVVTLLNDLESCSFQKLSKSVERGTHLSDMFARCQNLHAEISADLLQCVRNTRQILLHEIGFCYLFANYRSRIYSIISHVIQFNDIVFHPVLQGHEDLVILLEEVVDINVNIAALYIARSYHHKILSAHCKSVPCIPPSTKLSEVISSCQKCQVCMKLGHFLHKYCSNKCGNFLDSMSLMLQGAGDNRVVYQTDNCTSRHVEQLLSRRLLQALYCQANSSIFYEPKMSCGDKRVVVVHEQFSDQQHSTCQTRNSGSRKSRRRWEDNYTNVIYVCTQRGLPNTWQCLADIDGIQYTVYKLDAGYYSIISSDHAKELKLGLLSDYINTGFEEIMCLVQLENKDINDPLIKHLNTMSHVVLTDSNAGNAQVFLLLSYSQHLNNILHCLYTGYNRLITKLLSNKSYDELFSRVTSLIELYAFLVSLHKQLSVEGDLKVPAFLSNSLTNKLQATRDTVHLFKGLTNLESLPTVLYNDMRDTLVAELPAISYWRKDEYGVPASLYMQSLREKMVGVSTSCTRLPEPYLTRVHHILINNGAALVRKHILTNKKITFSNQGALKLESDVQYMLDMATTAPVSAELVLSTVDILSLRNDLNGIMLKRKKTSKPSCNCEKQRNWKRLSAPQLCSNCSSTPNSSPKPAEAHSREIFSDSEVDTEDAASFLKVRQKKTVLQRLDITM